MKKVIQAVLCLSLVLGIAVSALWAEAAKKFDMSGKILYRGRYYNLDFNNDSDKGSLNRRNYYGDLTLTMKFRPSENVSGCFEFYKQVYGTGRQQYNTIQTGETVTGDWAMNEDENWEMTLMQAWGKVDLPFAPVSLKIGRQPILLSDNGLYLNTGISKTFAFVADIHHPAANLRIGTVKLYEGTREKGVNEDHDDADINFVSVKKKTCCHTFGAFLAYHTDFSSAALAPGFKRTTTNLGVTSKGKVGPLTYKAEFDYMVGKEEGTGGASDVDIAGYAFMAGVGLPPIGKASVGLEVGMGSGDDPDTPDKNEGYIPPGPFYPYAWAYEYRFIHWLWNSSRSPVPGQGTAVNKATVGVKETLAPGLENTIYAKIGAKAKLTKSVSGALALVYLMAQQAKPIQDPTGAPFDPGKNIGIEVDTILNYVLSKHFSYQFILGYVIPGNFMDGRIKGFDANNNPVKADNAWGIRSQFAFGF